MQHPQDPVVHGLDAATVGGVAPLERIELAAAWWRRSGPGTHHIPLHGAWNPFRVRKAPANIPSPRSMPRLSRGRLAHTPSRCSKARGTTPTKTLTSAGEQT